MRMNVYVDNVLSVINGDINIFSNNYVSDENCNKLFNCSHIDRECLGHVMNGKFTISPENYIVAILQGQRISMESAFFLIDETDQPVVVYEWKDGGYKSYPVQNKENLEKVYSEYARKFKERGKMYDK